MHVLHAALLTLAPAIAAASGHAIHGRVIDPEGRPVTGASVSAYARETPEQEGERQAAGRPRVPLAAVRTGPDGSFRLLPAGPVMWVQADVEGHAPAGNTPAFDGPTLLTLRRQPFARGVVRAGGSPVAGAVVVWSAGGTETITRTAADGSYAVPDPRKGAGQVRVFHPGHAYLEAALWDGSGPRALDLELEKGTAVSGFVIDEAGRPVAGAALWLDGRVPAGRSDARGGFQIAHAHAHWRSVTARTDGRAGSEPRGGARPVVRVRPASTLRGAVRDAVTGRPVPGATVVATHASSGADISADTDAQGHYVFAALVPGRYRAYAGRTGYASGPADYMSAEPLDLRATPSARRDFVITPLPRAAGRVQDEQQRPVEGALVAVGMKSPHFYVREADGLELVTGETARTGSDGSFSLTLPPPDESLQPLAKDRPLVVLKEGYAAAQVDARSLTGAAASRVTVTLTKGIELAGRVAAPDGASVEGVSVSAAEDGMLGGTTIPTHLVLASVGDRGWTTTDAAGRFSIRVHTAAHHLSFKKEGFAPAIVRGHDPRAGHPLEVVLEAAAVLRGKVARADGRGISGVGLSVRQQMSMVAETATSAEDGTFEVGNLAPGTYELTASHADLGLHETRSVEAPASDVQIVLPPSGAVRGSVVDARTRRPVTRFTVEVAPLEGSPRASRNVPVEDAGGLFSVDDVPLGRVKVSVSAEGYATRRVEDVVVSAQGGTADVDLALEADAPIAGRVSSERGVPVAEAWIAVERDAAEEAESDTVRTDDDGEFELRGLGPGEVTLRVQAAGFLVEKRKVGDEQRARLEITLRKGLALRGEVVSEGVGVPGATVSAQSGTHGAAAQTAQTDERGRFALEGLVPGRYVVNAWAKGMTRAEAEDVDVETAGPLRLVLEKARTAVLSGKVTGLPAADEVTVVMVMAASADGQQTAQAMVEPGHTFRMDDAPAGRVQVRAMAAAPTASTVRSSRMVELTLAPGSETETVLEFAGDNVVRGTVIRNGAALPGAMVSFAPAHDAEMGAVARTDPRGIYEVAGLEPGPHRVSVFGDGVSFTTDYTVTGSADFDIDVTGATLTGRVVRADNAAPVGGVAVALFQIGGRENTPAETATTSAQGAFSQASLRDGRYRLVTSKAGFGQEVREVEVARGATVEVLIELQPAEGISLSVVDARNNRPLDAIVVVRDEGRRIVANSHSGVGEDGVLNIPLADGAYILSTSASGYGTFTTRVRAPSRGLRVGLTPGGTLRIESPRDLRGRVRLLQPDGEEYVRCWCNGIAEIQLSGRVTTVENVTAGAYTVEVTEAQGRVSSRPVVVGEGQVSAITVD